MVTKVNVVLFKSKTLKNGEHPVMLCVSKGGDRRYVSLGVSCPISLWDAQKGLPRKKHPLYTEIVALINRARTETSREVLTLEVESQTYTLNQLQTVNRPLEEIHPVKVLAYCRQIEKRLMIAGRVGYGKVFRFTGNSLETFQGGKDFGFAEINTSFLMRYEEWFMGRGVQPSSIFVFMRTLKTLLNYARKEKLVKPSYNPFAEFSFSKYRRIRTVKRAISKTQIKLIEEFACKPGDRLFHAKNYFLFSYYCRGINLTDLAFLSWENIRDGRLVYTRRKTGETFTMALLKPALDIVMYYRECHFTGEDGYIFPILRRSFHVNPQQIDNRIQKVTFRVNRSLKVIGERLGLETKLTTYVARHSFATVLKQSGTPIALISELMGHDSEGTTRIYLADFENEVLDNAAQAIL